jgi:hypothetical protein
MISKQDVKRNVAKTPSRKQIFGLRLRTFAPLR